MLATAGIALLTLLGLAFAARASNRRKRSTVPVRVDARRNRERG
jgi:hypothetical protein